MDDFTRTIVVQLANSEEYIQLSLHEKAYKLYCHINHIEKSDPNNEYDKYILKKC